LLFPICLVVALASAQSARAEFSASFTMTSSVADPAHVFPLAPITVTVWDTQGYGTTIYDNAITRIQLNWSNSSAGLGLAAGSTWTWGSALAGLVDYVDADMSDNIVGRLNAGDGIVPGTYFSVGTLVFNAPAYNSGGVNTHALNLTGGSYDEETLSVVACGSPSPIPGEPGGVQLLAPPNGAGLTLSGYNVTVVPGGYWTGATNTQWQTGTNWSSQMTPGATFEAVFDGTPTVQPALTKGEAVKSVEFRTGGWNVGGPTQTLTVDSGGITSNGAAATTNTIQPTVGLSADAAITVGAAHTLQLAALTAPGRTVGKEGAGTLKATDVTANILNVNDGAAEIAGLTGSGADLQANIAAGKTLTVTGAAGMSSLNQVNVEGTLNASTRPITTTLTGSVTVGAVSTAASLAAGEVKANVFNLNKGSAAVSKLTGIGTGSTATLGAGTNFAMTGSDITGWNTINVNTNTDTHGGAVGATGAVTVGGSAALTAGDVTANHFYVNSGSATINSLTGASAAASTANVAAGQTMTVETGIKNVNAINVDGTMNLSNTVRATSVTKVLNIAGGSIPTGKLDIADGLLVINYEGDNPMPMLRDQIIAAFNAFGWDGNGIGSKKMTDDPFGSYSIGYADNSQLLFPYGPATEFTPANPFGDTTDVTPNAILVRYTLIGDVDLNGVVDDTDISLLTNSYLFTGQDWFLGDVYLYDGVVDDSDVGTQANNYLMTVGQVTGVSELNAAPEPATLVLLSLGVGAMLARRRARK
jgi:hypothetical protein